MEERIDPKKASLGAYRAMVNLEGYARGSGLEPGLVELTRRPRGVLPSLRRTPVGPIPGRSAAQGG